MPMIYAIPFTIILSFNKWNERRFDKICGRPRPDPCSSSPRKSNNQQITVVFSISRLVSVKHLVGKRWGIRVFFWECTRHHPYRSVTECDIMTVYCFPLSRNKRKGQRGQQPGWICHSYFYYRFFDKDYYEATLFLSFLNCQIRNSATDGKKSF